MVLLLFFCPSTTSLINFGSQCSLLSKGKDTFACLKDSTSLFSYFYLCKENQGQVPHALKVRHKWEKLSLRVISDKPHSNIILWDLCSCAHDHFWRSQCNFWHVQSPLLENDRIYSRRCIFSDSSRITLLFTLALLLFPILRPAISWWFQNMADLNYHPNLPSDLPSLFN